METQKNSLLRETSLCTSSYLKSLRSRRASIVKRAMQSWEKILELPFAEKIFLDDGSPSVNGIKMLELTKNIHKFDEVRYHTLLHPPHCNFGQLACMTLCKNKYIMHIDDDIRITGTAQDCLNFLESALSLLDKDENILGINIYTMPDQFDKDWFPGKDYYGRTDFAHPNKYFGNAICLMKKELLKKVSLADIINWGTQQPDGWEKLVSDDPAHFLVTKVPTPFGIEIDAWVVQSTSNEISWKIIKYDFYKKYPLLKKLTSVLKNRLIG
jgi:hypothetical protein